MKLALPQSLTSRLLRANHFTLVAQSPEHNALDYAAVMSARAHLRAWSHSEWPEDDFTPEANAEDLQMHIEDAETGFAYGFTVFSVDQSTVYGSVYLNPIEHFAQSYALDTDAKQVFATAMVEVDYWLLPEREADAEFHREFLVELETWLLHEWGFTQPLFGSRPQMAARRTTYERSGLRCVLCLNATDEPPRQMWFHGRTPNEEARAFADPQANDRSA